MERLRLAREVWTGEAYAEEEWIEEWSRDPEETEAPTVVTYHGSVLTGDLAIEPADPEDVRRR